MKDYSIRERKFIYNILMYRQYLIPIFTSATKVPQLIKEYDKDLFVAYNKKRNRYELHDKRAFYPNIAEWSTYQMTLGEELTIDCINYIYANDLTKHGVLMFKKLDDDNDRLDEFYKKMDRMKMKVASKNFVNYINGSYDAY